MKNTEQYVKENIGYRWKIPKTDVNSFPYGHEPPLDMSTGLNPIISSY